MPKSTTKKTDRVITTAQKLGSTIKSARDKMRIDKGLNGELDRLPQLTWMMFLKLLDDSERLREVEAELEGKTYKSTIAAPYRWRDWAANENFTGDRLRGFIDNDTAVLPNGDEGMGLLAYLRSLQSKAGNKRADVIAKVFKDVILTNPPFGGEEEDSIKKNFPPNRATKETALLFLMLIMRRLRQRPTAGRAAVVFPNGVLFGDNACAKIKEDLLKEYNLHTIVRLPNGVFAPYTGIPTNILFFDRSQPTNEIWYYEIPLPEGRKNYTKTKPIQDEAFADCLAWWNNREENQQAWKYDFRSAYHQAKTEAEVVWEQGEQAKGDAIYWAIYNLDKKNPNSQSDFEHLPPEQLVADILDKDRRVAEIMAEIQEVLDRGS